MASGIGCTHTKKLQAFLSAHVACPPSSLSNTKAVCSHRQSEAEGKKIQTKDFVLIHFVDIILNFQPATVRGIAGGT